MEPTLPAPNMNPERPPVDFDQNFEQMPLPPSPEARLERSAEQLEQRSEGTPSAVNAAPVLPTPVVVPVPTTSVVQSDAGVSEDDLPTTANDDDVIEKEWVDKAKKIIAETRNDPHERERKVSKLQVDYLQKRYGKELGSLDV